MNDRSHLLTEQRLPESMNLDSMSIEQAVEAMNLQDRAMLFAVESQRANVARAIEFVTQAFKQSGRLIYFGAGTSGRLGVLDASECPPTFGIDPQMVIGVIAGGKDAMFRAKEGAEDLPQQGAKDVDELKVTALDVAMGIATGGTTPYVHGALNRAIELGARTIFLSCVEPVPNEPKVDVVIRPLTGPEVLTGSTRLKAGTATKLILNQITTISLVQLGKCYENLMVDLRVTNAKLRDRATRIVGILTGLDRVAANQLLDRANGELKVAIIMQKLNLSQADARQRITAAGGHLREAMKSSS
ncbi:MAG TPA: N-acetylmuramic acid 6-phosphate etherase [Tepidisphaeraceae bacterium]|nr:N-acetylmuramic acid 6-phosphate etherase [Tepidisphaeraceae bacterium]